MLGLLCPREERVGKGVAGGNFTAGQIEQRFGEYNNLKIKKPKQQQKKKKKTLKKWGEVNGGINVLWSDTFLS